MLWFSSCTAFHFLGVSNCFVFCLIPFFAFFSFLWTFAHLPVAAQDSFSWPSQVIFFLFSYSPDLSLEPTLLLWMVSLGVLQNHLSLLTSRMHLDLDGWKQPRDLPANFDESSFIFQSSSLLQLCAFPIISGSGASLIRHSQIMNCGIERNRIGFGLSQTHLFLSCLSHCLRFQ